MKTLRVSFDPSSFTMEGCLELFTGTVMYISGEYEVYDEELNETFETDKCLICAPKEEVFRVIEEWLEQKAYYCKEHWLVSGIDPEGTGAIDPIEMEIIPECRGNEYQKAFLVTMFESPDLENG